MASTIQEPSPMDIDPAASELLLSLPTELIYLVLDYLGQSDLISLRGTSRRLNIIAIPLAFRLIRIRAYHSILQPAQTHRALGIYPYPGRLRIDTRIPAHLRELQSSYLMPHVREIYIYKEILFGTVQQQKAVLDELYKVFCDNGKRLLGIGIHAGTVANEIEHCDTSLLCQVGLYLAKGYLPNLKNFYINVACATSIMYLYDASIIYRQSPHLQLMLQLPGRGQRGNICLFPKLEKLQIQCAQAPEEEDFEQVVRSLTSGCRELKQLEITHACWSEYLAKRYDFFAYLRSPSSITILRFNILATSPFTTTHSILSLLEPLTGLQFLEIPNVSIRDIEPGHVLSSGGYPNWSHVFNLLITKMDGLMEYSFKGCSNRARPGAFGVTRTNEEVVAKLKSNGEQFYSLWADECEALEKLREIVRVRRLKMGMKGDWR